MRILITGGAGCLGSNLIEHWLPQGHEIFVIDNSRLALVSQFQLFNWKTDPTTGNKKNPDFAAIASAYGIKSYTVERPEDLEAAAKAMASS